MATPEEFLGQIRARQQAGPRQPTWRILHALADRASPRLRAEFLRAVSEVTNAANQEIIETAIRMGNIEAAEAAIPWDDLALDTLRERFAAELRELEISAGVAAEELQPGGLRMSFDLRNPLATEAALQNAATAVTQVSEATKTAIREAIARAIDEGREPRKAAQDIRSMIGLQSRQTGAIQKLRAELESRGFPEAWIDRRIQREAERALRERALTIATHETMTAANRGQQSLWEQAKDASLLDATAQREWVVTPDSRLCEICRPLDGTRYALGETITTAVGTVMQPPAHVRCRCVMVLVVD